MFQDSKIIWLILAAILVTIFEFFSLGGIKLGDLEAKIVFGSLILIIGYKVIWHGILALYKFNFKSINLLMVIAVSGAFYIGHYEEAAVVIVLFSLAERLEDLGISKAKSSLDLLMEHMPKYAYLKGMDEPVDIDKVKVNDIIRIKSHHLIPLDGQVISGVSFVDESTITGEPIPQDKRKGDTVFAGTLNKQGILDVKVTRPAGESTLAKIRKLTFTALKNKAKTERFIEQFSAFYTPAIIGLAVLWTLTSWMSGRPFILGFTDALVLLVISCPCALVISTPISIFSAIGNASSLGILIKGGKYLEAMGQVKAVAFDKTRTLTYGKPVVSDVIPFGSNTRESLLSCAAGIELFLEHPLAQSVVEAAAAENLTPHEVEKIESILGKGAKADCLVCYDKHHCIGKLQFILEEHSVPKDVLEIIGKLQEAGKTVIVVSTHREVEGVIALKDKVREESKKVISTLKKMGIQSVMLTGDHAGVANAVAKEIGITRAKSELLPEDKSKEVQTLVKEYKVVAMVGDGVNDAPALASANVGVSMTKLGSDVAIDAASIVILNDHLNMLPYIIRLARSALGMIRFNTVFAVAVKFLFIALALLGASSIAMAIFADVGVTLFVVLNSLRLMKFK